MLTICHWGFMLSAGCYLALMCVKCLLAWRVCSQHSRSFLTRKLTSEEAASLTIIQPILGGDPQLAQTLEDNLTSISPAVRFVWLLDEDDPAGQAIGSQLAFRHSNVHIITLPAPPRDQSPKAFKLQRGLREVHTEYCVVLDDDTRIRESSLVAAVDRLEHCDLYTGLPYYRRSDNTLGRLLTAFVNNNSVLTYLPPLAFTRPLTINGMFYVFRTQAMAELGGFQPIVREVCDDYAVRKMVLRAGWRIEQGIAEQQVSTSLGSAAAYWRQMHRWSVFALLLVVDQTFPIQCMLGLFLGLPPLLLLAACIFSWCSVWTLLAFLALLAVRYAILRAMHRMVFASSVHVPLPAMESTLSELLQPLHLLSAIVSSNIVWRGRVIRLSYRTGQAMQIMGERQP